MYYKEWRLIRSYTTLNARNKLQKHYVPLTPVQKIELERFLATPASEKTDFVARDFTGRHVFNELGIHACKAITWLPAVSDFSRGEGRGGITQPTLESISSDVGYACKPAHKAKLNNRK